MITSFFPTHCTMFDHHSSEGVAKTLRFISKRIALPLPYLSLDSIQVWQAGPQPILSLFLYTWLFLHLGSLVSFDLRSKLLTTLSFLCGYFGDRNKAQRENYSLESLILEADVDVYLWKKLILKIINIIKYKVYHPFMYYYRDKLFLRTSSQA